VKIWVGRDFNEELQDYPTSNWYAHRVLWFAGPGDLVVLPEEPERAFLDYVTSLTRADPVRVLVPGGEGALTARRLLDPALLDRVRDAVGGRRVEQVVSLWPDAAVAAFADAAGAGEAMAGRGFFAQSGDHLANSKASFRSLAAGADVAIPPGLVCGSEQAGRLALGALLEPSGAVMLKHEFASSGWGNEILSVGGPVELVGAHRMTTVSGQAEAESYLGERWPALTGHGRHRLVIESYVADSRTVWAEYAIGDDGVSLGAVGALVPTQHGGPTQVIPAPGLDEEVRSRLCAGGDRLCAALRAVGYRGTMSADAIVTPAGEVLYTEMNSRITGSTHTYRVLGERLVGAGFGEDRLIIEREPPIPADRFPSFAALLDRLEAAGLGYRRESRSGVVLVLPSDPARRSLRYVVVERCLEDAFTIEGKLAEAFGFPRPVSGLPGLPTRNSREGS
jgi:hypothetical protein